VIHQAQAHSYQDSAASKASYSQSIQSPFPYWLPCSATPAQTLNCNSDS